MHNQSRCYRFRLCHLVIALAIGILVLVLAAPVMTPDGCDKDQIICPGHPYWTLTTGLSVYLVITCIWLRPSRLLRLLHAYPRRLFRPPPRFLLLTLLLRHS